MATTDAQLETLALTVRSLRETLARTNPVESPRAYDLVEASLAEYEAALSKAAAYPLTADQLHWRRAQLTGGRRAEVFNSSGGVTVAIRRADGSTERCFTTGNSGQALGMFRDVVLDDTRR